MISELQIEITNIRTANFIRNSPHISKKLVTAYLKLVLINSCFIELVDFYLYHPQNILVISKSTIEDNFLYLTNHLLC